MQIFAFELHSSVSNYKKKMKVRARFIIYYRGALSIRERVHSGTEASPLSEIKVHPE